MNITMYKKSIIALLMAFITVHVVAQDNDKAEKLARKALKESTNITHDANESLVQNDFVNAEGAYRQAISKSGENTVAPYNLGRAYYNRESLSEAFSKFKQAGEKTTEKPVKHKSYHNMGNVFMKNKEYQKAVEAYKESLRNNPNDDETRYNLALDKKKQQEEQKNDDNQGGEDNQDQKDQQDQNKDQNQDGENEKDKEGDQKDDQNKDEGDDGDKGNEKPEENKEGEGDEKKEQKQQPKEGEEKDKKQKPRPNQLSKQQIQNLLEAMQNEEKKVQQKIEEKKIKGAKIKNEKDW